MDINAGQGLQGAAGGAMAGSAFGPIGMGVGGALGGLMGLFGGDPRAQYQNQLQQFLQSQQNAPTPQMGPAAQAGTSPYESQRGAFLNQLQSWANGNGPSAAMQQMRQGMDTAAANQAGMAAGAGARGGAGLGGAQLNAANNTAALQGQTNQNMGILRSQEQMNAMNQYGSALQGAIGQGQDLNQFNATQQNSVAQANLAAQLQKMGITTNAQLQAILAGLNSAPPGLGTSLMAGGASLAPMLNGMLSAGRGGAATGSSQMPGWDNSLMNPSVWGQPVQGGNFTGPAAGSGTSGFYSGPNL